MIILGIIEDQAASREALCDYLGAQPEFCCVLCAASHEEFVAGLAGLAEPPTLVLSDTGLLGCSGVEGLAGLRALLPAAEVLLLSVHTDAELVFEALRQGAVGYLEKNTPLPLLKEHLLQVVAGGSPLSPRVARHITRYFRQPPPDPLASLTPREQDIVRGIEDGLSYKLIANRLELSLDTVRSYIRQIYRKLDVNSKMEVITKMRQRPAQPGVGRPFMQGKRR